MAIKDFTDAIASRAYRNWFQALKPNIIKEGSSALREQYEKDPTKNNFLLTDEKIKDMAAYVTDGREISDEEIKQIKDRMFQSLKNAKNQGVAYKIVDYGIRDPKQGQEIVIENVNFQTIETILESGFGKQLEGWKKKVGSGFHRGHVYGLPTVLLSETISKLEMLDIPDDEVGNIKGRGQALKSNLINILREYQAELRRQDQESSNMGTAAVNYDVYANYSKDPNAFLIEMQVRRTNVASGQQAGKTLAELKQFLNYEKMNAGVLGKVLKDITQPSVILNFLTSPGSPPWIQLVGNKIANAIDPKVKTRDDKKYKTPKVKTAETSIKLKRSAADKARAKKEIEKVGKAIQQLQASSARERTIRKPVASSATNLTNLLAYLNQNIASRVKQNMGTGGRHDVLNLRTGRFAESVKVERLSESRQGMITAFYNYMKNPYATFSQGGRQEFPKTRDPKLLIARSIREIAQQQVSNRLRAVVV